MDLDREMETIANTWLMLDENTGPLDLDEAMEFLEEKVETDAGGRDLLKEVRDSQKNGEDGENANALMADAMALLSVGETWAAVANLLVAWELAHDNDEDEASPLLSLAGLANSQGLPHVALALLGEYDDAETVLQQALALSPEMSEAARNLVYVLQPYRLAATAVVPSTPSAMGRTAFVAAGAGTGWHHRA